MPEDFLIADWDGLKLAWTHDLDGGGRVYRHDFIAVVPQLFGRVGRLFEFCAGPGFIGFSLLSRGLCDQLVLADVNPRAIAAAQETVRLNGWEDRVTIYHSDGLDAIPPEEQWDLVVSNPPHFPVQALRHPSLLTDDLDWRLHRDFYRCVGGFLAPGGSILMQENSEGARPSDFAEMITDGELMHVRTLWYAGGSNLASLYFLWVKHGVPGVMPCEEAAQLRLEIREPAGPPCAATAGGVYALTLVNRMDRPMRVRLVGESGKDVLPLLPPAEMSPGEEVELPPIALRAGAYEVRDAAADAVVARLRAAAD